MVKFEELQGSVGKSIEENSLTDLLNINQSRELVFRMNDSIFTVDQIWVDVLERLKKEEFVHMTPRLLFRSSESFHNLYNHGVIYGEKQDVVQIVNNSHFQYSTFDNGLRLCYPGPYYSLTRVVGIRENRGRLTSFKEKIDLIEPSYKKIYSGLRLVK